MDDKSRERLLKLFDELNHEGQEDAIEYIEFLLERGYRKNIIKLNLRRKGDNAE